MKCVKFRNVMKKESPIKEEKEKDKKLKMEKQKSLSHGGREVR